MIITVTCNPAWDKTAVVEKWNLNGCNRILSLRRDLGGKGINAAGTVAALGGKAIATGFLDEEGRQQLHLMKNHFIDNFIEVKRPIRTNVKLILRSEDNQVTEINEPGSMVRPDEWMELETRMKRLSQDHKWFLLSGSLPPNAPTDGYAGLIRLIHKRDGFVLLDSSGEALRNGMEARPDMIKPNIQELAEYFQVEEKQIRENPARYLELLAHRGIPVILLSDGENGSWLFNRGTILRAEALKVKAVSTVGAGDAMAAAYLYRLSEGDPAEQAFRWAVAAAGAACESEGTQPPVKEEVKALLEQVEIREIFTENL